MATLSDLKSALKNIMSRSGSLNRIEAQTRYEVFSALESIVKPETTNKETGENETNFLVNELILEYMKFNALNFSESVFRSETGHKQKSISRRLLCHCLNVKPTVSTMSSTIGTTMDTPVPLLCYFVEYFKSVKDDCK